MSADETEVLTGLAEAFQELTPGPLVELPADAEDVIGLASSEEERAAVPNPRVYRGDFKPQVKGRKSWQGSVRKYPQLSTTFFRRSFEGQVASIYKTRVSNPAKIADFKAALANGDFPLQDSRTLPKATTAKMRELGIENV